MIDKLRELAIKFEEIGEKLTLPDVVSDQKRYKELSKEYKDLEPIVQTYRTFQLVIDNIENAKDIIATETDAEMKEMAKEELNELIQKKAVLEEEIKVLVGHNTLGDKVHTDSINKILNGEEIVRLQTELISEKEYQKLQNIFENQYVNSNASVEGIADNLATYYMLYGDVNLINTEIEIYRSITREEIRNIAKKYLNPNQRLILDYVPGKDKAQN